MSRIVLTLPDDVTETSCGSCRYIGSDSSGPMASGYPLCKLFGNDVFRSGRTERLSECLAAEAQASRMVEIAPEDAAYFLRVVDGALALGGECRDPKSFRRVYGALRAHASQPKGDGGSDA